jgi:recombination protein RecA
VSGVQTCALPICLDAEGKDANRPEQGIVGSGAISLDIALGIGGYPRGRIIEIYGPESSGKTTLTLHAIAEAQRAGGVAAFIDAEHALDVNYAKRLGVKTDELLISQPDHGEQALEIADMLVRSGAVDVVVIDSVAALVPKAEIEGDMGDQLPGLQARLMSQALRKITGSVHRSQTTVLFINQIRMKIGVMFGNPETTTGGNALKFYATVRIDVRRIEKVKSGDVQVGNRTRAKVVKNKLAPPFRARRRWPWATWHRRGTGGSSPRPARHWYAGCGGGDRRSRWRGRSCRQPPWLQTPT